MFRLTESNDPNRKALAPRPIAASLFGLNYYSALSEKFGEYKKTTGNSSITSFLCTEAAFLTFIEAEKELHQLARNGLMFPDWKAKLATGDESRLSNRDVLEECLGFYTYFAEKGRRGTPH